MARVEVKGYIPRTSRILWSVYVIYVALFLMSTVSLPGVAMGVALVVFAFALYDTKKIREFCRNNNVGFPRKLWIFAALTLIFTIATLPIYMYVRGRAIRQIASNIRIRRGERYD
jgi:hypothetical protein